MRRSGLGNRRSLEFELNLTSFIDLLSTCTCFLLVTAVWIQVGSVEIKQSHGTEAAAEKKESVDLDIVYKDSNNLTLNLKKNGKQFQAINVAAENHEAMIAKLNNVIVNEVLTSKDKKKVEIGVATVTPRSTVNYGQLVTTLDVFRKNKIVNIGVLTAKGQ
jgi:biopolymer transport protein ExbD